ncbi:hypothetical protein BKA69DRAFT_100868 [Paraphysoderma sedebokerense]|nr:hypothetical protein BKA69DRAFT_100868 [Paraphysoderma sedebokerense]
MKRTFPTDSPRNSPRKSPRRSPFVPKQTASIESSPRSSPRRKAAINALVAISSPAKSSLSKELVLSSATEESQPQSKPQDENNDTEQFELVNFDDQENTTTNLSREKKRKKDRKSLGRRVSFAAAAHIRLFDKDENPWSNGTPKKSDNLLGGSNGIRFDEELEYGEGGNWQFELPDLNSIGRRSIGNAFDLRLSLDGAKLQTQEEAAEETAAPEPANLSVHSELESEAIQSSFDIPLKEPAEMPSILESHQGDTSTEEESNAPAVVADERDNIFVSSSAELSPASTNMNAENYELTRFSEVSMDLGDHISAIYGDNSVEADDTNMEITACYGGIQNQSADLITSQSQGYSFSPDEFLELSEAHQQDSPNAAAPRLSEVPLPDADKLTQELADDITETISTYMNDFRQEMSEAITEGITDYVHKIMEEENLENNDAAEHVEAASGAKHGEITEYIQQNQNQQQQQWEQQHIADQEDSVPPSPTGMEFTTHHGGIESQQTYQDEQDERLASSFLVDILTRDALVDGDIHGEHFTTYADSPNQYQDSPYRVSQASTMQQFHESPAFSVDERFLPASQGSTPYRMSTQSSAQKPTSRRNTPGSSLNARSWAMNGEQSMPVTQQATPSRLPSQMTHQERQSRTNTPGSVMSARCKYLR